MLLWFQLVCYLADAYLKIFFQTAAVSFCVLCVVTDAGYGCGGSMTALACSRNAVIMRYRQTNTHQYHDDDTQNRNFGISYKLVKDYYVTQDDVTTYNNFNNAMLEILCYTYTRNSVFDENGLIHPNCYSTCSRRTEFNHPKYMLRDWSLFMAWGWGAEDFRADHLIF